MKLYSIKYSLKSKSYYNFKYSKAKKSVKTDFLFM